MRPLGFPDRRPRCSRRPREPALLVRVGVWPAFSPLRVVGKIGKKLRLRRRPRIIAIEPRPPRIIEIRKMKGPRVIEIREG
jgi:hypothetical protein